MELLTKEVAKELQKLNFINDVEKILSSYLHVDSYRYLSEQSIILKALKDILSLGDPNLNYKLGILLISLSERLDVAKNLEEYLNPNFEE